jgi:hypothetical protein
MISPIDLPMNEIRAFCQRHGIRKLALFGSVLRDDFRLDSDVDVLVEFRPGQKASLFDMAALELELTALIGRKVDLRTSAELSRHFRQDVLDTAHTLYEQR